MCLSFRSWSSIQAILSARARSTLCNFRYGEPEQKHSNGAHNALIAFYLKYIPSDRPIKCKTTHCQFLSIHRQCNWQRCEPTHMCARLMKWNAAFRIWFVTVTATIGLSSLAGFTKLKQSTSIGEYISTAKPAAVRSKSIDIKSIISISNVLNPNRFNMKRIVCQIT